MLVGLIGQRISYGEGRRYTGAYATARTLGKPVLEDLCAWELRNQIRSRQASVAVRVRLLGD
jgi:hypothetical protein